MLYCTNIQGSALYDVTLGDKDLIDQIFEQLKREQSEKRKKPETNLEHEARPPRRGFTREVEAIYDLADNITALRAEFGKWPRTTTERAMVKRPWFPAELAQARMRHRAIQYRDGAIAAAQARWREKHGGQRA